MVLFLLGTLALLSHLGEKARRLLLGQRRIHYGLGLNAQRSFLVSLFLYIVVISQALQALETLLVAFLCCHPIKWFLVLVVSVGYHKVNLLLGY